MKSNDHNNNVTKPNYSNGMTFTDPLTYYSNEITVTIIDHGPAIQMKFRNYHKNNRPWTSDSNEIIITIIDHGQVIQMKLS